MSLDVRINKGRVLVGDREASLLSGAVHYWRLHPSSWENILLSVKEMGLETIETYIPWEFHEIEPNVYDFSGESDSRRNLAKFLKMTQDMGFWLIVRPGPFIYSEWPNMGVPTDVAKYHRTHEVFVARARDYIKAVCEVLVPFQATRGGHIIMLQPDNEADSFEYCYEEQLGLGTEPGLFQTYLAGKYGSVDALNERWGADLASFGEAGPIMSSVDLEPEYHVRYLDFVGFREDYVNRCVALYADIYRENGIDVPLFHNTYDIFGVQNFQGLNDVLDLVGIDAYPSNQFAAKTFAMGEQISHRRLQELFRYLKTFTETTYIAEYESGIGHGLHYYSGVLFPNQYTLTFLTAIQAGINCLNWYMLVNRDNWMMCPINEWGRKQRELFRVYAENIRLYKQMNVPALEKLTETSALFYLDHQLSARGKHDPVLEAIYDAGVDYEFLNLDSGSIEKPILFYSGSNWLPEEKQGLLLDYVERGGHLVFFQTLPLHDPDRKKANILGLKRPRRVTNEPFLDHLATETEVDLGGFRARTRAPFFVFDGDTPGEPLYGTRVDADIRDSDFEENRYLRSLVIGRRYQVGYREMRGKGSITVLGVRPSSACVRALHHYLGIPINITSSAESVKPAIFRGDESYYAILINMADHPVQTTIELAPDLLAGASYQAINLRESGELDDGQLIKGRFTIALQRKDGTVVEIRRR